MLVSVTTNNEVPPAPIVDGVNVLDTVGTLGDTLSKSGAVQVPAVQLGAELVLVTPTGGEMTAVLVIPVWACAS